MVKSLNQVLHHPWRKTVVSMGKRILELGGKVKRLLANAKPIA